jgi:hypothetical protein
VTVHTGSGRGNVSVSLSLDASVAVAAVDSQVPGMNLVTVRNRLMRLVSDCGILW